MTVKVAGRRPVTPAPLARRERTVLNAAHGARTDELAWLRDDERAAPDVLAHLRAENEYTDAYFLPLAGTVQALTREMRSRIREDDQSVPVFERGYWYYVRYEAGAEYPIHARRQGTLESAEEIVLDVGLLAAGNEHYSLGSIEISDDNRLVAYTEDTVGRLEYTLKVREIATGADQGVAISPVEDDVGWAADSRTVLYVLKHPDTLLGHVVRAHRLGSDPVTDRVLYQEPDDSYFLGVYRGRSGRYLYLVLASTVSTEYRVARADDPTLAFAVVLPRRPDLEYHVDDRDGRFLLLLNEDAPNFRLVEAPAATVTDRSTWTELVAHRADVLLAGIDAFEAFLVLSERVATGPRLRVLTGAGDDGRLLTARGPAGALGLDDNPDFAARTLRYVETTPTWPDAVYELALHGGEPRLLKQDEVPGVDLSRYVTEFGYATAPDGARIPVTTVRLADRDASIPAPLYQTAYGAYGIASDATFSVTRLSLIDRGFVVAIAHVRGGQELGRAWYDAGRLLNKENSARDFVAVTHHLVASGAIDAGRCFGAGGSAGGLLMAMVANRSPEDYLGLVLHVPFVDVLTSMLDENLPLTSNEYDEWGDPREAAHYAAIAAYSPLDNVAPRPYPAQYVTAGLWDGQVPYWEPAKWVQRVREASTREVPVLLRINLEAGHAGLSGRYARLTEIAEEYAFVLDLAGGPD